MVETPQFRTAALLSKGVENSPEGSGTPMARVALEERTRHMKALGKGKSEKGPRGTRETQGNTSLCGERLGSSGLGIYFFHENGTAP